MPRVARLLAGSLRPLLLVGFGLGASLYCGRRGFMPLDQSIVFDGGWRVLCGQVPFRDYVAPNGFVPHALQALFFATFGVTWLAYCLHAAVLNGLFAWGVDRGLRIAGAGRGVAFGCGLGSALVLTPPVGVPYMDGHAFFFSLAGVWIALEARWRESGALWIVLPSVLVLAALSKQIPSLFAVPIVLAIALTAPRALALRRVRELAVGTGLAVAVVACFALALGAEPGLVQLYFFEVPGGEAPRRLANLTGALRDLGRDTAALGIFSVATVPLAFAAVAGLARKERARALAPAALGLSLIGLSAGFALMTLNQIALALPPLFLAVGFAWIGLQRVGSTRKGWHARVARGLGWALLAGAALDAWSFHTQVNLTRSANDLRFQPRLVVPSTDLPPALSFLAWQTPTVVPYTAADLDALVAFLSKEPESFMLLGDASVLYGLTGRESVPPALWFHAGLAMPRPQTPDFEDYEAWLLQRMDTLAVRYLVLEGRHTWNHTTLDDFPRLAARVVAKKTPRRHFGGFRVVDLGKPYAAPRE